MRRGLRPRHPNAQGPLAPPPQCAIPHHHLPNAQNFLRLRRALCAGAKDKQPSVPACLQTRAPVCRDQTALCAKPQCAIPHHHHPNAQNFLRLRRPSMPGPAAVVAQRATCQGACHQSPSTPETHAQCAVAGCPMSSVPGAQTAVAQCAGPCKPTCLVRMPNKSARCAHTPGVSNSRY